MNILFVSEDLSGGDLAYRLKKEGNKVRLFVRDKSQRQNLVGMVDQVENWENQLSWVGKKKGLIIFDSTGFGDKQDWLRKEGYSVVGGCAMGDKIEDDRHFGKEIMEQCGIETIPSFPFRSIEEAITFVKKNREEWVIKQNGHVSKIYNYVGQMPDASDVIDVLETYNKNNKKDSRYIELQKRVRGVEIGVARYFNGNDWVGPIEMNVEHKSLCSGGLGPKTYEMGTLMWYDKAIEKNTIFQSTLAKMKTYLQSVDFRGDVDINCIVNQSGIYPLEITARLGFPSTQLQSALHISPWGEFLKAIADGKSYDLKYKKGFGVIVVVATPPFPNVAISKRYSLQGTRIFFTTPLTEKEINSIHFEEVSKDSTGAYYISSSNGFILNVSGFAPSIKKAQEKAYTLIEKIIIPKKFYRNDIGKKFLEREGNMLKKWGYFQNMDIR